MENKHLIKCSHMRQKYKNDYFIEGFLPPKTHSNIKRCFTILVIFYIVLTIDVDLGNIVR